MAFIRCFGKGKLDKMTLFTNYYETAAVILFGIGLTTLLLHKNMIKKIMGLYRKCYYIIAFVCLCIGSVITVFVPYLVNGLNFSDTYLRSIFLIYVLQTVFSYMWVSDTALLQYDSICFLWKTIDS